MQSRPDQPSSLLEIRNRKGIAILRAVGRTAIFAAVGIQLIRWISIVLLTQLGCHSSLNAAIEEPALRMTG